MKAIGQRTSAALRTIMLLALLVQSITSTGMLFKMASAQGASASTEFIVICTPDGLKRIARSDIGNEDTQTQHACVCACGILCNSCNAALQGNQHALTCYPGASQLFSTTWQGAQTTPLTPHAFNVGRPRAPPAYSYT